MRRIGFGRVIVPRPVRAIFTAIAGKAPFAATAKRLSLSAAIFTLATAAKGLPFAATVLTFATTTKRLSLFAAIFAGATKGLSLATTRFAFTAMARRLTLFTAGLVFAMPSKLAFAAAGSLSATADGLARRQHKDQCGREKHIRADVHEKVSLGNERIS
jgi:hypothetical protein